MKSMQEPPLCNPESSAEYWKAKYEALAAGVSDPEAVKAAISLVTFAAEVSEKQGLPFRQVFTASMEYLYKSRSISASKRRKKAKR